MRKILLIFVFFNFYILNLEAKSIVADTEPVITFRKLYIPEVLKQGQFYKFSVEFSTKKNLWEDFLVFFHIVDPNADKIIINNSFSPTIPTTRWVAGEIVYLGPINGYIPFDIPPGEYQIRTGLFNTQITPEGPLYVRQPYTNPEIKDFIVGKIKIEEAPKETPKKKEDLIISNFESEIDLKRWQTRQSTIEQDENNAIEGKYAGKVTYFKDKGCCPGVLLESFFRYSDPKYSDWSDYDLLQFYAYGLKDKEGNTYLNIPVNILIKDKSERRFTWPLPQTLNRDKPFSIMLSEVGKYIDLADIGTVNFFVAGTPKEEDWIFFIDDIRLISLGLEQIRQAFVSFEGIKIYNDKVKPGEELELEAYFSTSQRLNQDYAIFVHIYRKFDKAGWLSFTLTPTPATTLWEPNVKIKQGPFKIFIPPQTPLGKYNIEIGLFIQKATAVGMEYVKFHRGKDGTYYIEQPNYPYDYFKQPYVNYADYGDWIVGEFEVISP